MQTDDTKGDYVIGASEVEDSTNNALAMLGAGYGEIPTVVIEPPRTITGRKNGRMVEIEEPAWVKFSTDFKRELVSLDEFSLKVFLYIGLSVNWKTGEAYPGVRLIADETGMDKGTVVKAVANLEELGFLTIQRREGNSNIYTPMRYISIGTVRPERTVVSGDKVELSGETPEVYGAHEGNLHNKKNKNKQEKDLLDAILENERKTLPILEATKTFESLFGFGSLNWDSKPEWRKFALWITEIYKSDLGAMRDYVSWRLGDGKYQAMSNNKIRQNPQMFMDTGWPTFLAHTSMYGKSVNTQERNPLGI